MRLWAYILGAVALGLLLFAALYLLSSHPGGGPSGVANAAEWQRMASPGPLSQGHAFLEHNCAACHTPVRGVEAASCIACHANEQSILQRQPTAFHADVNECASCHAEHQGTQSQATRMDHDLFARLGVRQIQRGAADNSAKREAVDRMAALVNVPTSAGSQARITANEAALNCNACHANQDRHRQFFGTDCAQCHGTAAWTIPEFRHPPPSSVDCAQCHQAPPSHYMMHFEMVSMKAARQEHAKVNQCYLCHQTTSWNDIKGVGFYKHH